MREFNRFVNNTHPVVLVLGLLGVMIAAPTLFALGMLMVGTLWELGFGTLEASGIEELVPMAVDALDGEVGG